MIAIQSEESKISFLEFSMEIPKDLVHALKLYAKVKDGREEKPRKQWLEMYTAMMKRTTK